MRGCYRKSWRSIPVCRLHEALTRAVLGTGAPQLLWIEDLQWCDRDTLEWLHYLLRFDEQARLLVLGTLRPEEVLSDQPIAVLFSALRHDRRSAENRTAIGWSRRSAQLRPGNWPPM